MRRVSRRDIMDDLTPLARTFREQSLGHTPPPPLCTAEMNGSLLAELKAYVDFSDVDARALAALRPIVEPCFPRIVDVFYVEIERHPAAYSIVSGPDQIARLKKSLHGWLEGVFSGEYGVEFCRERSRIGRVHVRVGLPQHYMVSAMEVVRQEIALIVREFAPEQVPSLLAVHKLLSIELAIMLETYKESYIEVVRDVERQQIHERLTQSEHLARIGRLAASLAHEIKNPLAGISGAVQVIRDGMGSADPRRPVLNEVLRQIDRLDGTVKDLLVYARPAPPRFDQTDVPQLIDRVVTLLGKEAEFKRVRLFHASQQPLAPVVLDANQIEQVLMNLALNAAHASADGKPVRIQALLEEGFLVIEVADQGHGMDEETCRRAMEAFYTTKARGTGLGLSICSRIVEGHGGTMSIRSTPGQGTTVRVKLPAAQPGTGASG